MMIKTTQDGQDAPVGTVVKDVTVRGVAHPMTLVKDKSGWWLSEKDYPRKYDSIAIYAFTEWLGWYRATNFSGYSTGRA